jgi:hypothetical protein
MESDVLTEMRLATEALDRLADANRRHNNAEADERAKQWQAIEEIRDDLLALSNRVEALTRAFTTSPAQVAERGYIRLLDDTDSA